MEEDDGKKLSLIQSRHLKESRASNNPSTSEILYQHTVLCQACLPYRNPGDHVRQWERKNGHARLKVIAGEAMHPETQEFVPVGLPFGAKPRLILAYLNAEALQTGSPEIDVGESLTAFVKRVCLDPNGHTIRVVKDQLTRLSASILRLGVAFDERTAKTVNLPFVEEFELWFPKDERQRVLWPSYVRLNPTYFESLQRHAVPLNPRALAALSHSAMGLDLYAWLAQRLHRVKPGKEQFITWKALKDQFGWQYGEMYKFRQIFKLTLRDVLIHYSAARIEVNERGMILRHSAPPILAKYVPVVQGGKSAAPLLPPPTSQDA